MSGMFSRETIAQVVIILATCVGGWMVVVQPMEQEIAEFESRIAAGAGEAAIDGDLVQKAAARLAAMRPRLHEIERRSQVSGSSSALYGLISDLAKEHGVSVQRLQHGLTSRGDDEEVCEVNKLEMTVEGRYESVAAFLEAVGALEAYLRPRSLHLTAFRRGAEPLVAARFTCEALRFAIGEELAALEGTIDVQ